LDLPFTIKSEIMDVRLVDANSIPRFIFVILLILGCFLENVSATAGEGVRHVGALQIPSPHDTLGITATIPYEGAYASGEAYLYLAETHGSLKHPVIVVEGFDIDNTMNWDELYEHLNQEGLVETLRSEGYDIVVLNLTDATDYMQRNAFVLVELISQVNAVIDPYRDLAIVGASMGGLVARYALAYMETHGLDHRTVLFLSLDTPHRGANIPLGIQYWMDFFSGQSDEAAFLLGQLDRPAARQMLVYHHTDPPGTSGESDSLRAVLAADFDAVGEYPALPRMVAVANGSGTRLDQGFAPGDQIILYEYSGFLIEIIGNVWAVPDDTETIIFDGLLDLPWPFPDDEMTVTVSGTRPYDSAPGGTRASMVQMDTTDVPYGDIVALYNTHCFIPTISALDIETDDLFYDIAGDPAVLSRTPFDTIYYPVENQEHVAITPENAGWMLNEIHGAITAVEPDAWTPSGLISLQQNYPNPFNPVTSITFTLSRACHVELSIYSVSGSRVKTLVNRPHAAGAHSVMWDGRDERGTLCASGVYLYRLHAGAVNETRKMVLLR
jgi:hypothetical protein